MERGLYIAAAGMLAEQARQDQISQDLANAATNGYKSEKVSQRSFSEALLENSVTHNQVGPLGRGPVIDRAVTDFSQGALRDTGAPLDMAIAGEGFFAVQTARGIRFTRDGSFQSNDKGQLTDQFGDPVLGPDRRPVRVGSDGTVKPESVGRFAVTNPQKEGEGRFTGAATGQASGQVQTGALEASGVDAGRTMIDMMASLRAYEANQKVIVALDMTLQQTAAQVGTVQQ